MNHHLIILTSFALLLMGQGPVESPDKKAAISPPGCNDPLSWQIGAVDARFNINPKIIKKLMAEVGDVWSNAVGREVLTYSDSGAVRLNFIYGEEQEYTDDEQQLALRIDRMRLQHISLEEEYRALSRHHQQKLDSYNNTANKYLGRAEQYNNTMTRYVDDGVFPRKEKERLKELKKEMKLLEKNLDQALEELNEVTKKMNALSTRLNNYTDEINKFIFRYKEQFGSAETFHQGVFTTAGDQQKINIYQFENLDKLRLVLAHEVGHALGLGHVSDPKSVMYFKMEYQNEQSLQLSGEDVEAIAEKCKD